jgi:carbamate kinase
MIPSETQDLTVIACGGNALIDPNLPPTVANQFAVAARAMVPVAELIEGGARVILTHGNGPQVGFMQLRSELASDEIHEVPLDSLVADTQGAIGYMIQRALREELHSRTLRTEVVSVITEVLVDRNDRAFEEPTKPIGRFYDKEDALQLGASRGWEMVEDSYRGWRRVVSSPSPVKVMQLNTIRRLVDDGVVVVSCGGGGIPVQRTRDGRIEGIEAVIDKDRTSALLAVGLGARRLVITTEVDCVYRDFRQPTQQCLVRTHVEEVRALDREGQFPAGSMRPKIEAAIFFLCRGGHEVIICRPEHLIAAFAGKAGTRIYKE